MNYRTIVQPKQVYIHTLTCIISESIIFIYMCILNGISINMCGPNIGHLIISIIQYYYITFIKDFAKQRWFTPYLSYVIILI